MPNCNDHDLRDTLRNNLGKFVNIFTDSGDEFCGILSVVDNNSVKLVTLNNHHHHQHHDRDDFRSNRHCDDCDELRRILSIPINKIDCLASSQY